MSEENDRIKSILAMSIVAAPVGAVIVFIGLVIGTGNINDALTLVVFSIICTLGISLFIWIPLCWVTGLLVLSIITGILKLLGLGLSRTLPGLNRPVSEVLQPAIANRGTVKQQSLANYIRKAQAKGFSETQINNRLRQEGWSVAEIEQAQDIVGHFT